MVCDFKSSDYLSYFLENCKTIIRHLLMSYSLFQEIDDFSNEILINNLQILTLSDINVEDSSVLHFV